MHRRAALSTTEPRAPSPDAREIVPQLVLHRSGPAIRPELPPVGREVRPPRIRRALYFHTFQGAGSIHEHNGDHVRIVFRDGIPKGQHVPTDAGAPHLPIDRDPPPEQWAVEFRSAIRRPIG